MTALHRRSDAVRRRLRLEPGSWLSYVQPSTAAAAVRPAWELLSRSAERRPGNLRFARTTEGLTYRGEVPLLGCGVDRAAAVERLSAWLEAGERPSSLVEPSEEHLESALAESGWPFKRRNDGWIVPAATGRTFELAVQPIAGGARIEAGLAEFETLDDVRRRAAAEYALRTHADLRFVRIEVTPVGLGLTATADAAALDEELLLGFEAVADARRRLALQLQALVESAALAEAYLAYVAEARRPSSE